MKRDSILALTMSYSLLSLFSLAEAQSVFRWVDQAGKVHYSDRPPMESVKQVQEKRMTQSMIQTSGDNYAMLVASRKYPATLYVAMDCTEICQKAQELLQKRGITFSTVDVSTQPEKLIKVTGNTKVPVLTLGNDIVLRGWEEKRWLNALDQAGYPKNVVVRPTASLTPTTSHNVASPLSPMVTPSNTNTHDPNTAPSP